MGFFKSFETRRRLAALGSNDAHAREAAVKRLGQLNDPSATPALCELLLDRDPGVRLAAVETLSGLADTRAIGPLVERLTDHAGKVRESAFRALNSIDPYWPQSEAARRVVPSLLAPLSGNDSELKRLVIAVLGKVGDPRAMGPLIQCLTDSPSLRSAATAALDEISTDWRRSEPASKLIHSLILSMAGNEQSGQEAARKTLDMIAPDWRKSEAAQKTIDGAVHMLMDRDSGIRKQAAAFLESLGWKPATAQEQVALLVENQDWSELATYGRQAIDYLKDLVNRGDAATQSMAAKGITMIGGPEAVSTLMTCLIDGKSVLKQRLAATCLGELDPAWRSSATVKDALPGLLEALGGRDAGLVDRSSVALALIADASIVPRLIEGLESAEESYAGGCAQTLGLMQNTECVRALVACLSRAGAGLTGKIILALGRIGSAEAQNALTAMMTGGGPYCREAQDALNRGRSYDDGYVLCPVCRTFLGVRKELVPGAYRAADAGKLKDHKAGTAGIWYRCPGCGDQVMVG